ncbi:HlyIII-domain-containing protein [Sodiomyces alkalinus F11]|uniref:HlyIII-domain-containing protein n=1 Tax=Sodiomyces alkalinus (strain CBS 110278 / VKM F-3762 / F11) TaxID=1314773 RepID=A0A3N2PJS8_SODAK|nr:HlyIII-domain-containing protein [Sodiomyces alkalinus F11]ROT34788.1 HlyIII-domain-containing protein [Sodiomyces alkalinus F11]
MPSSTTASDGLSHRRGSTTTTLLPTGDDMEPKVLAVKEGHHIRLLTWDNLPAWQRDNTFILTGYRRASSSYRASLASLTYLHNETVNIWSHLLGALFFLLVGAAGAYAAVFLEHEIAPRYATASLADVLVFACFFAGAVACLGMSATYHALSNHSRAVARWGNKLDYAGIVVLIVGSYVPALYYGFWCHPELMTMYQSTITLLGFGCGMTAWLERFRTPPWRPLRAAMFVGLGLSGIVPVLHGLKLYGREALERRMSLSWVVGHGALYVTGAFIYAVRWPERSFPRRFDIWGSSHQIFHFFVVAAAATHFVGMGKAFDYHHGGMAAEC